MPSPAACKTKPFLGRRLDTHTADRKPQRICNIFCHLWAVCSQLRALRNSSWHRYFQSHSRVPAEVSLPFSEARCSTHPHMPDPCPENAVRCRPVPPPLRAHPSPHAPAHPHPNVLTAPSHTGSSRRLKISSRSGTSLCTSYPCPILIVFQFLSWSFCNCPTARYFI